MGCVQSTRPHDEARKRSDEIERQIKRDRALAQNEIKMLLLGAGESGKSTLLKQMKLIHQGGYNEAERESFKEVVFSNVTEAMRAVVAALPNLSLTLKPQHELLKDVFLVRSPTCDGFSLPRPVASAVYQLWRDPAIRTAVSRSREFQLDDNAAFFFNSIERIASPDYMPTDKDILCTRVKTTGITETSVHVGQLTYKLVDVGGQRSERRKWINCFENVTALVFLVGLSEYDQVLYEDETVNRMDEAFSLFDSICNSRWFLKTSIILFLNKIDLFAAKLPRSPLIEYFPDYSGGGSYDAGCEYFLKRFIRLNKNPTTKQIYAYFTCATDTEQIKFVLSRVQDILLQSHLRECGLL